MGAWKRTEYGWLRADGEVFLERGATLTDTGNPAWLVWIRALDSEINVDKSGAWAHQSSDPVRRLSEVAGQPITSSDWFVHRGDEGWLRDAKRNAEIHLQARDRKHQ